MWTRSLLWAISCILGKGLLNAHLFSPAATTTTQSRDKRLRVSRSHSSHRIKIICWYLFSFVAKLERKKNPNRTEEEDEWEETSRFTRLDQSDNLHVKEQNVGTLCFSKPTYVMRLVKTTGYFQQDVWTFFSRVRGNKTRWQESFQLFVVTEPYILSQNTIFSWL